MKEILKIGFEAQYDFAVKNTLVHIFVFKNSLKNMSLANIELKIRFVDLGS